MSKAAYILVVISLLLVACKKDVGVPIVVSQYTSKFNGRYVGEMTSVSWNVISGSSTTITPGYEIDIRSGFDSLHNITTIPSYTYIQFDNSGYFESVGSNGGVSVKIKNDSMIYNVDVRNAMGAGFYSRYRGKKQ